ncbi:MAG: PfkB family carbohydrate kinase [Chloroflexota bacterium]|nr:PfkB family carbohydrate kinase [Chloroflexota bacterium]
MRDRLLALIGSFAGRRIAVVGDLILDEYLIGRVARMSREAPIPVLEFEEQRYVAGGAANPAANLAALGVDVRLIGVVGADAAADALRAVLWVSGITPTLLVGDSERPTALKTRIMAHMGLRFPQQVARMDRLSRAPLTAAVEAEVSARLRAIAPDVEAVLISDYRGGMVTPRVIEAIHAGGFGLITADSQGDFDKYRGVGVVKCNADEAREVLRRPLNTEDEFAAAARDLYTRLDLTRAMVITRGGDGATVATQDDVTHSPAPTVTDVYDTVGAGDTAIAVITLALLGGASPHEAVTLANIASGIVVRRVGNYAPHADELRAAIRAAFP